MAKQFDQIDERLKAFIEAQPIFFVASATAESRVNVSPKGLDCLRVLGPNRVIYLDLTGSGNETAAHLKADGRLTLMFCAFQGAPMILRLYGQGVRSSATSRNSMHCSLSITQEKSRAVPGRS